MNNPGPWLKDTFKHVLILGLCYATLYGLIYLLRNHIYPAITQQLLIEYFYQNPWWLAAIVLLLIAPIRIYKYFKTQSNTEKLLTSIGLYCAYKNPADKGEGWAVIKSQIRRNPANLRIFCTTGWTTLGSISTSLHRSLLNYEGDINVLFINPECRFVKERANNLGINLDDYRREIYESIKYCQELKKRHVNITVALYNEEPVWKMVIIDEYVWVKHYNRYTRAGERAFYGFVANKEEDSLYYPLVSVFIKMWNNPNTTKVI